MSGLIATSLSGLRAAQRALETVQHNIANVNTDGYSRQRVELGTNPAQLSGDGFVGQGVTVTNVTRSYDQFINKQLSSSLSAFGDVDHYHLLATSVDNIMADPATGIAPVLNSFFNAVNEVANNPTSIPSRQVLLSETDNLTKSLNTMNGRFEAIRTQNNSDMNANVNEINSLAASIANLNVQLADGLGQTQGLKQPNDLLDQQDALLAKLAAIVNVSVVKQKDGASSVFIGNGQTLVQNGGSATFTTLQSEFDPNKLEIGINTTNGAINITNQISGGSLAGSLRFRNEVLDPAQQQLGRVAAGLAMDVNALHKNGFDLSGNPGSDLFSGVGAVPVISNSANTGNAVVTVNFQDVNVHPSAAANLDYSDFSLKYVNAGNGVDYTLTRARDNQVINLTATTVGGISTLSFAATQPTNFDPTAYSMASTVSPGIFTPAVSDGRATEATLGAFTPAAASAPGQTFTLDIDGITFPTITSGAAGDTVTGANLDGQLHTFLVANPGYQQVSGSFATNDLRLRKLDGTTIVPTITSNFGTTSGALGGNTFNIAGSTATPGSFSLNVDNLQIYTEAATPGGTVTKAELDAAMNTFLTSGLGAGLYTKTGSFANNDLVLSKLDGKAITLAITSSFASSGGSFSGPLTGAAASPAGIDIQVDLRGGKTIAVGDESVIRPTYSTAGIIGVAIADPGKIAVATNVELDPVTHLPVSIIKGPMPSDNRNGLLLANLQTKANMLGGKATFNDAYGQIVSGVGTLTRAAELSSSAQQTLLNQAKGSQASLSGVNLDEEAANLLRFQQAYQASAQSISVTKSLFDTLIGAVR